jgi:flavin-dependent dehydrogenase
MPAHREPLDIDDYRPTVLIIGGGLAASATALGLARSGVRSLIVERGDDSGDVVGESIPSSAQPLLFQLGLSGDMEKNGHLPYYANRSAWGGESLDDHDFINTPYGYGWHIDRRRFESDLARLATDSGARRLTRTRVNHWERCDVDGQIGWKFSLTTPSSTHESIVKFVVDATGRASWFARQMGSQPSHDDRMVGLVSFLPTRTSPDLERVVLVEAVESGWWYTAGLPDERLVTVYFSDAELIDFPKVREPDGWMDLVDLTEHTARRINDHGYFLNSPPRTVPAGSSLTGPMFGEGWLAVGDAAAAYDPVSSYGITSALAGGLQAAQAIKLALEGDDQGVENYAAQICSIYAGYLESRAAYYGMERRWPDSPFWSRRFPKKNSN